MNFIFNNFITLKFDKTLNKIKDQLKQFFEEDY